MNVVELPKKLIVIDSFIRNYAVGSINVVMLINPLLKRKPRKISLGPVLLPLLETEAI